MVDCFAFESRGDASMGVYARCGQNKWQLLVIVNPDSAETWGHRWPEFATDAEIVRWKTAVGYHRVQPKAAFMLGEKEV